LISRTEKDQEVPKREVFISIMTHPDPRKVIGSRRLFIRVPRFVRVRMIIVREGGMRTRQSKDRIGEAPGAPAPDAVVMGLEARKARSEAIQAVVKRYERTVAALESAISTLPDLATLVVTTDRHRQAELRKAVHQALQLTDAESVERRSVERLAISKADRERMSPLYRRGAELRRSIEALCDRAEELFSGDIAIPAQPTVFSPDEEKALFRAMGGYRQRYLAALYLVPFIQERSADFLHSVREKGGKISQVTVTKRSKGESEEQLCRHVDANLVTVRGILRREGEATSLRSSEKIAKMLVETPLTMERLSSLIKELGRRTSEIREREAKLLERHSCAAESGALDDTDYGPYLRLKKELGGGATFAETQFKTLQALREPYQRIQDYILNANRRLVGKWVSSLTRNPSSQEDLMQEATIGLMRAVEKYDVDTGLKFSTVASWWIMQAIKRKRLMNLGPMEVPGYQLPSLARIWKFDAEHGSVSAAEAAKRLDLQPEMVKKLRASLRPVISLSGRSARADGNWDSVADLISSPQAEVVTDAASLGELRDKLESVFSKIQPRLVEIIRMRFGLQGKPMTLAEVGDKLGITRERVRQLEAKALMKLKLHSRIGALEEFAQ
jgi:RNA polymerase sigma factor (sigma-70 family)